MSGYFVLALDDGTALAYDETATNKLTTKPKDLFDYSQYFKYENGFISAKADPTQVFDIYNHARESHSPVGMYFRKNEDFDNQQWIFDPDGFIWSPHTGNHLVLTVIPGGVEIDTRGFQPKQKFNKIDGLPEVRTTFINKTNGIAIVYWLNQGERQVLTLNPGESNSYDAPKGAVFVAKDSASRVLSPNRIVAVNNSTVELLANDVVVNPASPVVVTHEELENGNVEISWTPSDNAVKYVLTFIIPRPMKKIDVNDLYYTFTPTKGVKYSFYVEAVNSANAASPSSNVDSFTLANKPPSGPSAPELKYNFVSVDRLRLEWDHNGSSGTTYTLYQTSPFSKEKDCGEDHFYEMNVPLPGDYVFHVVAKNQFGVSPKSNVVTVHVADPASLLPAPVLAYSMNGSTKMKLEWFDAPPQAPAGNVSMKIAPVKEYVVNQLSPVKKETVVPATGNSLNLDISPNDKNAFTIAAVNSAGVRGPVSRQISFQASTAPSKPTLMYSRSGTDQVTLRWASDPNNGPALSEFSLYRIAPPPSQLEQTFPATTTTYTFTPTKGVEYKFFISARNVNNDDSPRSDEVKFTIPVATPPSAPLNLAYTLNGTTSAHLKWDPPTSDGESPIDHYTVKQIEPKPETTFNAGLVNVYDVQVVPGTKYTFEVFATNKDNKDGPSSNSVSFTVPKPATAPAAPINLHDVALNGTHNLFWTAPADNGSPITHYIVTQLSPVNKTFTTTDPKFTPDTKGGGTFSYYVQAVNAIGTSPISNTVTFTVPKPAPPSQHLCLSGFVDYNTSMGYQTEWNFEIKVKDGHATPVGNNWQRFVHHGNPQSTAPCNVSASLSGNSLTIRLVNYPHQYFTGTLTKSSYHGSAHGIIGVGSCSFNFSVKNIGNQAR